MSDMKCLLALGGFTDDAANDANFSGASYWNLAPERRLGDPAKHRVTKNHDVYKCVAVISLNHDGEGVDVLGRHYCAMILKSVWVRRLISRTQSVSQIIAGVVVVPHPLTISG
jgi:hypothetical protein